jgi:hypothetical protein
MLKRLIVASVLAATASYALAVPTTTVEDSTADAVTAGLLDRAVADVSVGLTESGENWTVGLLEGTAMNGATFIYSPDPCSPGDTNPNPQGGVPPATEKFVTFVSLPRAKDANGRYTAAGAASIAGASTLAATSVRINFFDSPPADQGAGYIERVAITLGIYPQSSVYVALSPIEGTDIQLASIKTQVGTDLHPAPEDYETLWGIWTTVPEPASLALLVLGGLATFRRR